MPHFSQVMLNLWLTVYIYMVENVHFPIFSLLLTAISNGKFMGLPTSLVQLFLVDCPQAPVSPLPKLPARRRYHKIDPTPGDEPLPSGRYLLNHYPSTIFCSENVCFL